MAEVERITQCVYCLTDLPEGEVTRDHVIPLIRGGHKGWQNIAVSCKSCNTEKGCLTASEYMAIRDDKEDMEALKRVILAEAQAKRVENGYQDKPTSTFNKMEAVRRKQDRGECIKALGFKCECSVCDPNHPLNAVKLRREAGERFRQAQLEREARWLT